MQEDGRLGGGPDPGPRNAAFRSEDHGLDAIGGGQVRRAGRVETTPATLELFAESCAVP
jgi:hypothetical protein